MLKRAILIVTHEAGRKVYCKIYFCIHLLFGIHLLKVQINFLQPINSADITLSRVIYGVENTGIVLLCGTWFLCVFLCIDILKGVLTMELMFCQASLPILRENSIKTFMAFGMIFSFV
jgi:hypothetical protein